MFIARNAKRSINSVRRSGIQLKLHHCPQPFRSSERSQRGFCSSIYKHVTPNGVKPVHSTERTPLKLCGELLSHDTMPALPDSP